LEAILHPAIRARFDARLDALTREGFEGIVVFDAPVMIESGGYKNMDRLIVVVTDEVIQRARLVARDADAADGERRIASQMPLAEKAKLADYVIDNTGDRAATEALARPPGGRALVVGNLPYSVGTTILTALTRAPRAIDAMALMLQREVAERVAAAPGSKVYGSLSVHVQLHWHVELALRVPPGAFRPPPKVESAVLRLAPLPSPRVDLPDEQRFEAVVRAAFARRRKTLANALATGLGLSVGA